MKFKVGDKVRVREDSKYSDGKYAGATGYITYISQWSGTTHPYEVEFDEVYHLTHVALHANELVAV